MVLQTGPDTWLNSGVDLIAGENQVTRDFEIKNPKLWWPRGYGDQPLYPVICRLKDSNGQSAEFNLRTGIRTVRLVQDPDPDGKGKSFYFEINGTPVFAIGANYIPSDVFVPRLTPADYKKVIESATFANMNMLRVWGGWYLRERYFL